MSVIRVLKKLSYILSAHQKFRVVELGILMVIGGLLETCSVAFMIPFINTVMNPEETMRKWYVRWICNVLNLNSSRTFFVVMAIILALIYILKNLFLLWEYNVQYKFVYKNMQIMQRQLLEIYLHKPYVYFLHINSSAILRVVGSDTSTSFSLLQTLLAFFVETIVSVMVIVSIFVITPHITLCIAVVLMVMLLLINALIKPMQRRVGISMQKTSTGMSKWLLQSVQGIKELKVMHSESYFLENYDAFGKEYVRNLRRGQVLGVIPRFVIEAVSMSAMFFVVAVLIYQGGNLEEIVPMLSAVAMAALRLMPSANRIAGAMGTIALNEPMLDTLIEVLDDIGRSDGESRDTSLVRVGEDGKEGVILPIQREIDFRKITFHYQGVAQQVLENASFTIHRGESIGLVGESGAGKTTAVDIILGLLKPQEGSVLVDGTEVREDLRGWYGQIGYIPQMIFMLDGTIRANVAFGISDSNVSDEQVWKALEDSSLAEFVRSLPDGLDTEIGERGIRLSGGQRQRIGIARALYRNPAILIFDEATSALDNETEAEIMESITRLQGQKTMIIIAHRLTTIENCDHVYRVEGGRIIQER